MSLATVTVSADSLIHNVGVIRSLAPTTSLSAVVKDNAYGHGVEFVVKTIEHLVDGFSVATVGEGIELRELGTVKPIWVFTGFDSKKEIEKIVEFDLVPVVHSPYQIDLLKRQRRRISVIVEIDTGLGRLGFRVSEAESRLSEITKVSDVELILSHFTAADQFGSDISDKQMNVFNEVTQNVSFPRSMANSGGIVDSKDYHLDWIRPGLLLYGVSPVHSANGVELGLRPALTFSTKVIAVREMKKGDQIGYGASWQCPEDMLVGLVRCGYGDGYPRVISSDAKVSLNGCCANIIGRISMDSLAIDLRSCENVEVGAEVVLWGPELPVEVVADQCWTIPNELLTRMTRRVNRINI